MSTASVLEPVRSLASNGRNDEPLFEIINGQVVEMPPMSAYASFIAFRLADILSDFARPKKLGLAVCEVLFHLAGLLDRNRRPDAAFVSCERWPLGRAIPVAENAWDVVPDLAIEVVSPSDQADDLMEKIEEYFRAGVKLVWVVYPIRRLVYVFESMQKVHGLDVHSELDGGTLLPGFRLPLKELFSQEMPAA
jgi:Uma2 family endonuclease